jgi:hypothetical protein
VLHQTAYATWPLAVVHGLGVGGADSTTGWVLVLTLGCIAAVGIGLVRRLRTWSGAPR